MINNKWWVFTILSFICAYLDPYFGLFAMIMVVILFFDVLFFIILKGHYNLFKQKLIDKKENKEQIQKLFSREVLMFKISKLFTTIFGIYGIVTMIVQNITSQTIMAPFYILIIQKNFILQMILISLALASIIFSCVLFWFYADLQSQKFNKIES